MSMKLRKIFVYLADQNRVFGEIRLLFWRIKNIPDQIKVEKGIKKRKAGIQDVKFERLKDYRNLYLGKRCFIIATGPSLTLADLELLNNEITFGMNSIVKIFGQTQWRPTYYGIQDRHVYEALESYILKEYKGKKNVFIADQLMNFFQIPSDFLPFPYNGNYHIYSGKYEEYSAKFSSNAYEIVYDGYSITYSLIQIAVYMGFKEIYLLGCDCNYPKGEKNHFVDSGFKDKNAVSNPIRMRVGYKAAKEFAKSHYIKIINCTRGGMLEVFPRMELEEVLEK